MQRKVLARSAPTLPLSDSLLPLAVLIDVDGKDMPAMWSVALPRAR